MSNHPHKFTDSQDVNILNDDVNLQTWSGCVPGAWI